MDGMRCSGSYCMKILRSAGSLRGKLEGSEACSGCIRMCLQVEVTTKDSYGNC